MTLSHSQLLLNAATLSRSQPALAAGLEELTEQELVRLGPVEIPFVSEDTLSTFAQRATSQVPGDCMVLLGLSSPTLLREIRTRLRPDQALIVVEPTLELALRLLATYDYRDALGPEFTAVVFASDDSGLGRQLEKLILDWGINSIQLMANPMRSLGDRIRELVAALLQRTIDSIEIASAMSARYAEDLVRHISVNTPRAFDGLDFTSMIGTMYKTPALVIGAGPSLEDNLDLVKELAPSCVTVAVDAALPSLLDAGLTPDFVCTLDVIGQKAETLAACNDGRMPLISLLSTHPDLIDAWSGPRALLADGHPLAQWMAPNLPNQMPLPDLGNVAHLAFASASALGCQPIGLVGIDYTFARDGRTYSRGVTHQPADIVDGTSTFFDDKTVKVTANDGKSIAAFRNMPMYAATLSRLVVASKLPVFTVASTGIQMTGVQFRERDDFVREMTGSHTLLRPIPTGEIPEAVSIAGMRRLHNEMGLLAGELRSYAADAMTLSDAADLANQGLRSGTHTPEEALGDIRQDLATFGRHRGVIEMLSPMQPGINYEIARLTRRTSAVSDPVQRAQQRILALAGPARAGADLAEHIADGLYNARKAVGDRLTEAGETVE